MKGLYFFAAICSGFAFLVTGVSSAMLFADGNAHKALVELLLYLMNLCFFIVNCCNFRNSLDD